MPLADRPAPARDPPPKPGYRRCDPKRLPRLGQRPGMSSSRMIVEVMQNHRPLRMMAGAPGKPIDFRLQLLDQSLLVRRYEVHAANR